MKNRRVTHLLALCWLAALILGPGRVSAYDSPDFDVDVFSADGIFLPTEQQSSLLEALAAIASNFTDNARVDDDLREKALALSLRLDPMHYHSRLAHRALTSGTAPVATTYFDSLTVISETLWNLGSQLSRPPLQPEGIRLAPYLLELALITHPQPPAERLDLYATATNGKYPLWENFTTLQPDANRSTTRTLSLRNETDDLLAMQKRRGKTDPAPGKSAPPTPERPQPEPSGPAPVTPIAASLTVVASIVEVDGTPVPGRVSLMIRPPQNRIERTLLAAPASTPPVPGGPTLPLIASNDDLPVGEIRIPSTFATERSWTWPAGAVGEVGFTPSGSAPPARPATLPNVMPQAAVLVGNLLGKTTINDAFVLSGEAIDATSAPLLRDPLATAKATGTLGKKYLLVPASALEALVASLQKTGQLALLFQTELIAYSSLAEALTLTSTPTDPALIEASAAFDEIEAVSTRMSFPELSRNAKVQERLEGILTKYPNHLSARAMLGYGRLPVTQEMKIFEFAMQLEALVQPFVHLDEVEDADAARLKLAEANQQFARLRLEAPTEFRDVIAPFIDLFSAAGGYLGLSDRDSSVGQERLKDVAKAFAKLESGFSQLSFHSAVFEEGSAKPTLIEGESLVSSSRATAGNTRALELTGLPESWSGDHQLWWTGANPGDTCTLTLEKVSAGSRTITLYMTNARNYAIARISVGNLFKEVDFYSREMELGEPLVFENVEVQDGESLEIVFQIIGTNPDAEPLFFLGIDRIEVQ